MANKQEIERNPDLTAEKLAIREVAENWAMWRDTADWERFATVWHPEGWMTATWFQDRPGIS